MMMCVLFVVVVVVVVWYIEAGLEIRISKMTHCQTEFSPKPGINWTVSFDHRNTP